MDFIKSPNYNSRPVDTHIWCVVVHASVNSSLEGLIAWFQNSESKVSAHYCIGKDGCIVQMVKDEDRAWHAGVSEWQGVQNVNDFSIGIELVNLNDGQDPYPIAQVNALISLLRLLCVKYDISPANVVRHADVNTSKTDPRGLDMDKIRSILSEQPVTLYIHGLHAGSCANGWASTGADLMRQKPGTVLFTEIAYTSTGQDYRPWANLRFRVAARLNHSYGSGTIPVQADYQSFANECARFVSASHGCKIWIIGNEINCKAERPPGEIITPQMYAECFNRCEKAIHAIPGHEVDLVIPAAIGPWNAETGYPGNEVGDWIIYFRDMLTEIINLGGIIGGIVLHVYTHGPEPILITHDCKMGAPFEHRQYDFRCYREFMAAIPQELRHVPVIISEANENDPWVASGWIETAYQEIDGWNQTSGNQQIRAMCLFRYPSYDKWHMEGKEDVLSEFKRVVETGYKWNGGSEMPEEWTATYTNHCNDYHLWGETPQIKVLDGFIMDWNRTMARPEMDLKEVPQKEVYPDDPPRSGVGFLPYATFDWWMRTESPVTISAGVPTKLRIALMIVAHGIESDPSRLGDCGMKIGISAPNVTEIDDERILWMADPEWRTVRKAGAPGQNAEEYIWYVDETPEYVPTIGQCHIWIRCVANVRADISAGHFDLIQVLQKTDQPVPPPTGEYTVIVYNDQGIEVARVSFPVGSINPQICGLAQQIVGLSCQAQTSGLWNKIKALFKR